MIARRNGCIINISSSVIKRSKSKESLYGMSKGGLEAITKILAKEVGNYNIRVNAIAPGPFYSQMNELDMEAVEMIKQINAIPRLVTLNEIANVVLFLCSDFSSAITGQIISVDNGFSI